jgi:hypothetical protein
MKNSSLTNVVALCAVLLASCAPLNAAETVGKGAAALLTPEVAGQLQLTDAQNQQIQAIVRVTSKKFRDAQTAGKNPPGLAEELDRIRQAGQDEAIALLTPDQKATWGRLAGQGAPAAAQTLPKSTAKSAGAPASGEDQIAARSLIIPTIAQLKNPPSRDAFGPSANLLSTEPHPPRGDAYVILTDQTDPAALAALQRLVDFRHGTIVHTPSLGDLYKSTDEFTRLQHELRKLAPRYLAIAPKPASYRENMHLCVLKLLSSLDDRPGLGAFPGYLVGEDATKLGALIDRTIAFQPITREQIKPVSLGTIEDDGVTRYRSYQKAKVMQKLFADQGKESPAVFIVTNPDLAARDDFPKLGAGTNSEIAMMPGNRRQHFDSFSEPIKRAMSGRNVLFMFGHGVPDRLCGMKVSAFGPLSFANELVFCGSCMSASPPHADRVNLENQATTRRFGTLAMDNGAVMVLGHMGLCGGFPEVYPMAEQVFAGLSVGEAYQRVMNGLIGGKPLPDYYGPPAPGPGNPSDRANTLLFILWADPALTPIKK